MIYQVFNFKSLKIVLAKTGADSYFGYSVDTKYPEFNRPLIRGSIKEVVEVCIYLYTKRLLAAHNCEGYEVPNPYFDFNSDVEVDEWVNYVLNRYMFATFNIGYAHTYKEITTPYIDDDGVACSLVIDRVNDGIAIKYWEDDEESW